MCGISGIVDPHARLRPNDITAMLQAMNEKLRHRGPDWSDTWLSHDGSVGLGHTRLSIVDLSAAGQQPMASSDSRWTITYNGELYNTDALRNDLRSVSWRGHSDTEVIVEYIAKHGVLATLRAANGMFAFGCWDSKRSELWLARDRFGEKPLYYAMRGPSLLFASELKALLAVPGFSPDIDRRALGEYFRWTNVPAPMTIYEGVCKLPPGHYLHLKDLTSDLEPRSYWSAVEAALTAPSLSNSTSPCDQLEEVVDRAVAGRMVADVPLGAFLSGGIDSSSVVASMQRLSSSSVRTFTIGFTEKGYDESAQAAAVAAALGTDHSELIVSPSDAMGVIPDLPKIYDEPFADSSQIPTFLVSQMARNQVTVALSGEGGDELFGGYDRYRRLKQLEMIRRRVPSQIRRVVASAIEHFPVETWDKIPDGLPGALVPAGLRHRAGERMHKAARLLKSSSSDVYTALMVSDDQTNLLGNTSDSMPSLAGSLDLARLLNRSPFERAMLIDTVTYLPNDLLTKIDRASMAVSLEVRTPFLDPHVFQFAWGLTEAHRTKRGQGKWLLRELLRRSLPEELIDRPKVGFGIPVGTWLRGPLRPWADELLDPALIAEQGLLDPSVVGQKWAAHRDENADLTHQIWPLLMFQAWLVEESR